MPKVDRKKIAERLLRERLGLDEDWLNRDDDGATHLPSSLPPFLAKRLSQEQLKKLEAELDQLVAAGCRREALYFCLALLSPCAEEFRAGSEPLSAPARDDEEVIPRKYKRPLATRQDLEAVANKAKAARKQIRKYRDELLLAAHINPHDIPGGLVTTLPDPDEALSVLANSLTWVSKVAESYTAPFAATLLKSKGLLYLTLYVSICTGAHRASNREHQAEKGTAVTQKHAGRSRPRTPSPNETLASVARLCTARRWAPSDLRGKLKRFQQDHPALCATMRSKLAELHRHSAN